MPLADLTKRDLERAELAPVSQVSSSVVGEERSDIWLGPSPIPMPIG
jgi:hypothetical protein